MCGGFEIGAGIMSYQGKIGTMRKVWDGVDGQFEQVVFPCG
jgi:hypothetical protein